MYFYILLLSLFCTIKCYLKSFRIIGRQKQELVYSDPNTFSGPDEDPTFDFDDELVVMAKDLGDIAPAKSVIKPKNVKEVSRQEDKLDYFKFPLVHFKNSFCFG